MSTDKMALAAERKMDVETLHEDIDEDGVSDDETPRRVAVGKDELMKKPAGDGERVKRKAKRLVKHNSGERAPTNTMDFVVPHRRWKNSRRSRNGYGRGLPKKGGAGGKGVWGLPGSEILEEDFEDHNDPNYDSDDKNIELKEVIPDITPEEYFKRVEPIFLEYYEHGDTLEVAQSLYEETTEVLRPLVTSIAIEIAMDHKQSHREMTSVLISDLYGRVVSGRDISRGFDMVLKNLPDLILDTPEAPTILGNFIARAVADDCVPPRYVTNPEVEELNEYAIVALKRADTLLNMKKGWAHLDNVWGMGGPLRPVKIITKQMTLLLQEYLSSRDIKEAHRCLLSLEVPHFHHELVYEVSQFIFSQE
uniref:MI domain-containing protein n=1 Tax=Phlebotomus papatasi TaxID=29031 RepID=A0A1B0D8Z0_PHLPP